MNPDGQNPSQGTFAPMEPVRSDANYDVEMDGNIAGVDVAQQLRVAMGGAEDDVVDPALRMFYNGEFSYDEYMRSAGGQTVNEEMGENAPGMHDLTADDDDELDEEEEDDNYDDGDVPSTSQQQEQLGEELEDTEISTPFVSKTGTGLPVHVRNLMHEVVTDELEPRRSDVVVVLPPPVDERPSALIEREKIPRKLSKTMDALLGQANLIYARGNTEEALSMLLEVIRQEPRNSVAYQQVSDIYSELNDREKSLQYGLLAAHLDCHTPSDVWAGWGDVSSELKLLEEAAACYGRAIKLDQSNWKHYEKRIEMLDKLGLRPLAMRTRLQAAQMINHNVQFEWFDDLIRTVAQYYITINDEDRSILALEAYVLRSKEFGMSAHTQHETLIGMWIAKNKYIEAGKSIFALCDGIQCVEREGPTAGQPAMKIMLTHGSYSVDPFPPQGAVEFIVDQSFPVFTLTRLVVCFIGCNRRELATPLKDILLTRDLSNPADENYVLEIARAYYNCDAFKSCKVFAERLREWNNYNENAEMWFIYGNSLSALKDHANATEAFEHALQINPSHVDARINLSGLQQRAGLSDKALETLQDYDLDSCSHLPDERLLVRQADVLFDAHKREQFVRCVRMLLTPHFYEIHRQPDILSKRRQSKTAVGLHLSNTLRVAAMNCIQNSQWEKFVKRLGSVASAAGRGTDEIDPALLHDYCLKLIEALMEMERHQDMLVVCCYSFLLPRFNRTDKASTFQNLLFFCAIKAGSWPLAFEFVRWYLQLTQSSHHSLLPNDVDVLFKRIFNAMNYVFCHSQNVSYHRFIMRALAKAQGNHALQVISGNNSLVTGTYRHALGEYLRAWTQNKKNPLICLLVALTFTHMACKKDISSRHMIALRGIAFMKRYVKGRNCEIEVNFNLARMFHQMSIAPLAIHFYEKVLASSVPIIETIDADGHKTYEEAQRFDMRRFAAHNLALIYRTSGNDYLARRVYEQFLVV